MKWLRKLFGGANGSSGFGSSTEYAIDLLMRNLCDIEKSLPLLESAGLRREEISKIYNLTVIACAQDLLETVLTREQIPDFYILADGNGSAQQIRFDDCPVYQAAKRMVTNYGQGNTIVGSMSGQMRALNWCLNQLGDSAKSNAHRISMLPPELPVFGQAETRARIEPS